MVPIVTPPPAGLRLSELLGALSHALDLTEGQPKGHCVRVCWIGMQVGQEIGLSRHDLSDLYYTLLLKDLGCSSNAARLCQLYLTDDLGFKRDFKRVGDSLPQILQFVVSHTGLNAALADRFRAVATILQNGGEISRELIETRCHRGADIARQLRFSAAVADGIRSLDEHWDGRGKPAGLRADQIPLYSRIALLAQVVDVFHVTDGAAATGAEIRARAGRWFDPALVHAFERVATQDGFWSTLAAPDLAETVLDLDPALHTRVVDDDYLDEVAAAFAQVVDAKSPFTSGHSTRVSHYTDRIAATMRLAPERTRWLARTALLHDIGKLGVSNAILDKPGKLDAAEWDAVRRHPADSAAILNRIAAFRELAAVAGAHHERLDGKGYPFGVGAESIPMETRILTAADIFDALTAERPYRPAMPVAQALVIMRESVGSAIDPDCFDALRVALDSEPLDRGLPSCGTQPAVAPPAAKIA